MANQPQAGKWTKAVRHRLPDWIKENIQPIVKATLAKEPLDAQVELGGKENLKLLLHYRALAQGTGYVSPVVTLEFGARATGEPHEIHTVTFDIARYLPEVSFPTASPQVMNLSRTFWEKATAAHVFRAQGRIRGERYARHWHDLVAISRSQYFAAAITDYTVASTLARHKSYFFASSEKFVGSFRYR